MKKEDQLKVGLQVGGALATKAAADQYAKLEAEVDDDNY